MKDTKTLPSKFVLKANDKYSVVLILFLKM